MKKIFVAIKQNNFEEVQRILEKNPELVNCIAKAPPKKDDGQSALQVAIKNGSGWHDTRIISYLLDLGADVNFMEDDKGLSPREICCMPVLGDMAHAVYYQATPLDYKYDRKGTEKRTKEFMDVFARMLDLGADPDKMDNRLHSAWRLAIHDGFVCQLESGNPDDYNGFLSDITKQILDLVISHGADIYHYCPSFPKDGRDTFYPFEFVRDNQILINNMMFYRELTYGISDKHKFLAEGSRAVLLELMRPYYAKDNPYYGAVVSEERKAFFEQFETI